MDSDAVWKLCFDGRASHGFWPSRAGSVRTRATLWDLPAVGGPLPVRSHLCWWRGECGAWAAGLRLSRSGRSAQHGVIADSAAVAAAHNSMSAAPTCCDIIALSCRRYKHWQGSSKRLLVRGLVFCYEAVRDWEAKLTQILSDELRQRRHRNRSTAVSDILSATQETVRAAPSSG
jgi:hypothetical protein